MNLAAIDPILRHEFRLDSEAISPCRRRDSNPHASRRHPLKMVCLPIPPLRRGSTSFSSLLLFRRRRCCRGALLLLALRGLLLLWLLLLLLSRLSRAFANHRRAPGARNQN